SGEACWRQCHCKRWSARRGSRANSQNILQPFWPCSNPHELHGTDGGGAVHHQVALVANPGPQPGQWLGRGALNCFTFTLELAAMTRTGNDAQLGLPYGQTSQMGADRAQCEEPFVGVDEVYAGVDIQGDRIHGIAVRPARIDNRRWLEEHVWRQELIGEYRCSGRGDAQGTQS